jgi:hypothetical protein
MFTKTAKALVAALVLTGVSLSLIVNASAAPRHGVQAGEQVWMDRASNPNTNGF